MSYQKIHVDNTTCWRRFHISWDDAAPKQEKVEIQCLHCGITVFERENHPKVKLCRDENLMQNLTLSSLKMKACEFKA